MEMAFWVSFAAVAYAYFGYPLLLSALGNVLQRWRKHPVRRFAEEDTPRISILIPAHNEGNVINAKLENTLALYYPGIVQIIVVSDGSTDETAQIVRSFESDDSFRFINLPERKGKANALNCALESADGDIVVFSDASIMLDRNALCQIVQPFSDPRIGCVSGEDHINSSEGEGLYGRYELSLRNKESRIASIVGASGSFYAQRRHLIKPFLEGIAPDFLSVLNTVEQGYRAISEPRAFGFMTTVQSSRGEFQRKVRTLIRGMAALFTKRQLLNPFREPVFAWFLFSHKLMRWLVPVFLLVMFATSAFLLHLTFFGVFFALQVLFYTVAVLAHIGIKFIANSLPGRIALYFSTVNLSILVAWVSYASGVRQEIWTPSKRTSQLPP